MIQDTEITRIVPIAMFQAHKDYLTRLLLSPDVKHLATCSADHTAKVWNLDPDYPKAKEAAAAAAAAAASAKLKGKEDAEANGNATPAAGGTETPHNANMPAGQQPSAKDINDAAGFAVFAPNTTQASGDQVPSNFSVPDGPPMDPNTGALYLEATLSNHQRWVWDCAFSADSAYLVTVCSDHYARLWELSSAQIIRQYSGHHRGAVCVALNDYSEPR